MDAVTDSSYLLDPRCATLLDNDEQDAAARTSELLEAVRAIRPTARSEQWNRVAEQLRSWGAR